ncbi:adenylate/guanylate cyclase domain-containing protein [Enterovirga rhinocerotis]|uniref:Adenylate cyclase n=1 Tax=Enterovirga rhinocerotis TaxID=1339210 RepID=A0A4R7CBL3_9HYPH|nr:adenylate/guanylate cyclase domain-containing protein [Enterovirga rhinocerotis]TDR94486.1 adenylate cyclase [Enterovirga rhinocerotis]
MASPLPDTGARSDGMFREAHRRALQGAGLVRAVLGILLYVVIAAAGSDLQPDEIAVQRQVEAGKIFVIVFSLIGLMVHVLARKDIGTLVLPYVTVVTDATLILGNLAYNHLTTGIPGNMTFLFPVIWVVPIALAANAIYLRPGLQIVATAIYLVGIPAISLAAGYVKGDDRVQAVLPLLSSLGQNPNEVRMAMLVASGLVLVLAAYQGQRLLGHAVHQMALRLNLTRYLPQELAPVLSEGSFEELRAGQRMPVALLFVDIRGSTALSGAMDPAALARFITAFRRRVARAAAQHGGIIDKFVGDGAFVVFGVPRPGEDDAARALACALTLADLVERWNAKRGFDPPVRVGIGVHCGEVFCGVVGDDDRLEFTVLGEPVNVASRLESATKTFGESILASSDVIDAAGEDRAHWREVSTEPLRGVGRSIAILAPLAVDAGAPAT